jgi:hypothetical protein
VETGDVWRCGSDEDGEAKGRGHITMYNAKKWKLKYNDSRDERYRGSGWDN